MSTAIWTVMIPFMLLAIAVAVGPLLWVMVGEAREVAAAAATDTRSPIWPFVRQAESTDEVLRAAS
jgi:hypothetical protein